MMPEQERKPLSRDDYLKALALVTLGNDYARKGYEIEAALKRLLNGDDSFGGGFGHITDMMYSSEPATVADFDEAMKRASYVMLDAQSA